METSMIDDRGDQLIKYMTGISRQMQFCPPVIIAFLTGVVFSSCERRDSCTPEVKNITESVYAPGIVKTRDQHELYSNVSGIAKQLLVTTGDTVVKDTPLLVIKDDISKLNYDNARASADYADLHSNSDRLRQLEIRMKDNMERVRHDSILYSRQRSLWTQGIGTRNELDQRELTYVTALDNYKLSQLEYREAKRELLYTARRTKNDKMISESELNEHTIRAIADGVVFKLYVDPGEHVAVTQPIGVIGGNDDFYVELEVDEYDISKVHPGQLIEFQFDLDKEHVYEGTVESIDPLMNTTTRSFTVKANLRNWPDRMFPYSSADASIIVRQQKEALVIPVAFLQRDSTVRTRDGNLRKVKVGAMNFEFAEILEGLTQDDVLTMPKP